MLILSFINFAIIVLVLFLCCDIQTKTLQEILEIQKDRFPSRQLPWILTTLTDQVSPLLHLSRPTIATLIIFTIFTIKQIIALNGLATEGIFRIPADFDEVLVA